MVSGPDFLQVSALTNAARLTVNKLVEL
jgi:hypothetical protein